MQINILNINLWLFFWPISIHNKKRLNKFITLVHKTKPDIITLQEVWLNKYVNIIEERLSEYYSTHSKRRWFNQTGLLTLSKQKPTRIKQERCVITKKHNMLERLVKKGYQILEFSTGDKKYSLINAHLYDPLGKIGRKINRQQFDVLKKESIDKNLVILSGDLNIALKDFKEENQSYFKCFYTEDFDKNKYQKKRFNRFLKYYEEYILIKNKKIDVKFKTIKEPLLSDHFGVQSTINL